MDNLSAQISAQPIIINTRPVERAVPLTQHLQAAGFTVVDMPMLALQTRTITAGDVDIMRAWLAGEYQALVMVSPTAAAAGLALWQTLSMQPSYQNLDKELESFNSDAGLNTDSNSEPNLLIAPSQLIAVGTATAEVLQQAKFATASYQVLQPIIANNEGMLAMPEIASLQAGDKLLIWRGLGGRRLLVDTLQARGVVIDSIAWYERTMPNAAAMNFLQWWQQYSSSKPAKSLSKTSSKNIVIISSGSAFENWQQVVSQAASQVLVTVTHNSTQANSDIPKLEDFVYVVLGVRLADMLAQQQLDYLQVEDLLPATILAAIHNAD